MNSYTDVIQLVPSDEFVTPRSRLRAIMANVAAKHNVSVTAILSNRRTKEIARARREVCVTLYHMGLGVTEISRVIGKNHASVSRSVRLGIEEYKHGD